MKTTTLQKPDYKISNGHHSISANYNADGSIVYFAVHQVGVGNVMNGSFATTTDTEKLLTTILMHYSVV